MRCDDIIEFLRHNHGSTTKQIAAATGFSRWSVQTDMTLMRVQGLAAEVGLAPPGRGRPEIRWTLTEAGHLPDAELRYPVKPRKSRAKPKLLPVGVGTVDRAIRAQPSLATVWNERLAA